MRLHVCECGWLKERAADTRHGLRTGGGYEKFTCIRYAQLEWQQQQQPLSRFPLSKIVARARASVCVCVHARVKCIHIAGRTVNQMLMLITFFKWP